MGQSSCVVSTKHPVPSTHALRGGSGPNHWSGDVGTDGMEDRVPLLQPPLTSRAAPSPLHGDLLESAEHTAAARRVHRVFEAPEASADDGVTPTVHVLPAQSEVPPSEHRDAAVVRGSSVRVYHHQRSVENVVVRPRAACGPSLRAVLTTLLIPVEAPCDDDDIVVIVDGVRYLQVAITTRVVRRQCFVVDVPTNANRLLRSLPLHQRCPQQGACVPRLYTEDDERSSPLGNATSCYARVRSCDDDE